MTIRSTVSRQTNIGSKTSSVFPATVVGEGGITIAKSGNTTTIGFDLSSTELEAELQDAITLAAASADAAATSATAAGGSATAAAESAAQAIALNFDSRTAVEATTVSNTVNAIRTLGYTTAGDGGGALYARVVSEPSHAGKVQSDDGAWWEIREEFPSVRMFGALGDGTTDDTTSIQDALSHAVCGTSVYAGGGRFRILNDVTVPTGVTLFGGFVWAPAEANVDDLMTKPAIMLSSTASILADGPNVSVKNLMIYRDGMTLPAADSSDFAGVALNDNSHHDFSVIDCVIFGFDTAVYWRGGRPYFSRLIVDCAGVDLAAVDCQTGNSDSGYGSELRILPLATGNGDPTASMRAGTGLRCGGGLTGGGPGIYITECVVENFAVANYHFQVFTEVGSIWSETLSPPSNTSIGILDEGTIIADQIYANGHSVAYKALNGGGESYVGCLRITVCDVGVQLGDVSNSGTLTTCRTSVDGSTGPAINYANHNCAFRAQTLVMADCNGGVVPYISADVNVDMSSDVFAVDSILTDIGYAANLFLVPNAGLGFYASHASENNFRGVAVTLGTPTGVGSTGTYALHANADAVAGIITLSPSGTGLAASGTVDLILPTFPVGAWIPYLTLMNGSSAWIATSAISASFDGAKTLTLQWNTNGAALSSGQTYKIAYQVKAM